MGAELGGLVVLVGTVVGLATMLAGGMVALMYVESVLSSGEYEFGDKAKAIRIDVHGMLYIVIAISGMSLTNRVDGRAWVCAGVDILLTSLIVVDLMEPESTHGALVLRLGLSCCVSNSRMLCSCSRSLWGSILVWGSRWCLIYLRMGCM